jgi:hypothetical protein
LGESVWVGFHVFFGWEEEALGPVLVDACAGKCLRHEAWLVILDSTAKVDDGMNEI